jgi:hypothetical protein
MEQQVSQHREQDHHEKSEVQSPPWNVGKLGRHRDQVALGIDPARLLQRTQHHPADQRLGHEIEQQRADHFEHAEALLEKDGNRDPDGARCRGAKEEQRLGEESRKGANV